MIAAQSAIEWATLNSLGQGMGGMIGDLFTHPGSVIRFAAPKDGAEETMFRTGFFQINLISMCDPLGADALEANRADAGGVSKKSLVSPG